MYGAKNLKEDMSYAPEGLDSFKCTKIFKDTKKEIIVVWVKGKLHKKINYIEANTEGSIYRTVQGLGVESTLDQLVKVNGKRINFSGTGWDYGGGIVHITKVNLRSQRYFSNFQIMVIFQIILLEKLA